MSKFFVNKEDVTEDRIYISSSEDVRHISKVLRLKRGDRISVSDNEGWEYDGVIDLSDGERIEVVITDKQRNATEPKVKVTLFQGIPKQGKMEYIIQKCVELGIYEIKPVFMKRTVVADKGNIDKKIIRWQKKSAEAVKQCMRGMIPCVQKPVDHTGMIGMLKDYDLIIFPYENERNMTIKDCLRGLEEIPKNIAVIIGPEGGFDTGEAENIIGCGGVSVSLGKTVLRTETAGMAAVAMIMYELEL